MENSTKLKPVNWGQIISISIIVFIIVSSIALSLRILLTHETKLKVFGGIFIVFAVVNFVVWFTSKNSASFIMMFISLAMAYSYLFDYKGIYFAIPMIIFAMFYLHYVFSSIKYQSNYRKILELAARPVNGSADGFTARPLPVGKAKYSIDNLLAFARFMKKHYLALPYLEKDRVLFVVKEAKQIWFGKPNLKKDTYIIFDFNGNISVNISKSDYQRYKEELTFDQLCIALGNMFRDYLHYFRKGEKTKIFSNINSLK